MTIREAYSQWSTTYDHDINHTRDLDQRVTRELLGDSKFHHGIEIGCGTGKNTPFYLSICQRVTALDFSPGMLQIARQKIDSTNVTFLETNLRERWPVDDAVADLVACNLVLEHIDELGPIFSEASRCLKPAGEFYVCELHPFCQYEGGRAKFQRQDTTTFIDAYLHHFTDFYSAANSNGFYLADVREWWVENDQQNSVPRLISFRWAKVA